MGIVATELGQLFALKSDIAFWTLKQISASNKLTNVEAQLTQEQKYEESWNKAYDKCFNAEEGKEIAGYANNDQYAAERYAYSQVRYDPARLEELNELDVEYDTMKTLYETLLQEARAEADSLNNLVSQDAKDTGISGGR